ncbi:predicted protein [Naegleria gruberi]|uniref:Predicted protein n=1 Tax=Naegleria gruberi TaxID=5762 RepID=D2W443_NAEGR|nr:uncharacterized protein NAEGRDRAFT_76173 [Naegleria gruberi]EFC36146.1 predicted protein [Naegleria gruberi]|eukprot:XP_002668890.1 predicted protein [Naegleria gruberi strain NEG-M]
MYPMLSSSSRTPIDGRQFIKLLKTNTNENKGELETFFPLSELEKSKIETLINLDNIESAIVSTSSVLCTYPNPLSMDVIDKITMAITSNAFFHNEKDTGGKKSSEFFKEWTNFVSNLNKFKMNHPSSSVFYTISRLYEETTSSNTGFPSLTQEFFLAALHCNIYFFENYLQPQSAHIPALLYKLVMLARAYRPSICAESQMTTILEHAFKMFRYVYWKHNANITFVSAFDERDATIQFPLAEFTDCCIHVVETSDSLEFVKQTLSTAIELLNEVKDRISHNQVIFHSTCLCKCYSACLEHLRTTESPQNVSIWEINQKKLRSEINNELFSQTMNTNIDEDLT